MLVRPFESPDQAAARCIVMEGLGEHFGFVDPSKNPDLDDIEASYPKAGRLFLVAEAEGRLVGTAGLLFEEPGEARIVRMSVRASHRRRGVASALLGSLIEEARARSLRSLVARTEPHWADATAFYARSGFEPFGADGIDVHLRLELGG